LVDKAQPEMFGILARVPEHSSDIDSSLEALHQLNEALGRVRRRRHVKGSQSIPLLYIEIEKNGKVSFDLERSQFDNKVLSSNIMQTFLQEGNVDPRHLRSVFQRTEKG